MEGILILNRTETGVGMKSNPGIRWSVWPALWLVACIIIQPVQAQTVTLFEGARLITGEATAAIEDSAFLVENDRITAVGKRGELNVRAGTVRVDLSGKTVMPAIIDTHKHLAGERDKLLAQLRELATFGIGAVMSLGHDVSNVPFEIRDENIPGTARIYTAGRGITMPEPGRSDAAYWVTSEAEARQAVREQAARKVNLIKIWVDDREGQFEKLPPAMYAAIIDEAHKHKLKVTAHIFSMDDAKALLNAGIDAFAHGIRDRDIDEETVALFKKHPHVVVVPNMPERGVASDMSWLKGSIPDAELSKLQTAATDKPEAQKLFGIQARNLDKLNKAGVKIAFGTDGSVAWEPHVEMENMVASGMSPAEVIMAATKTSAEMMQLTDSGIIAKGKIADFIVLDANPLEDITNTRKINAVYIRGVKIAR